MPHLFKFSRHESRVAILTRRTQHLDSKEPSAPTANWLLVYLFNLHQVLDLIDHTPNLGRVVMNDSVQEVAKAKGPNRFPVGFPFSVGASNLFDPELAHVWSSSLRRRTDEQASRIG